MIRRILLLMSVSTVLVLTQTTAQQRVEITLDEAIKIALNDNPTIQIAELEIERQEYVRKETMGNLLPNITGGGTYNYNLQNSVMFMPEGIFGAGTGGAMRMGFDHSYTGTVSLALPLYLPTVYKTLQLNEEQMVAAVEAARASKITLVNQVKKSYLSILLAESSLEVIEKNIEYAEVVVNDTRNSYNQGLSSEYDLITAEVQLNNLKPTLIQTQNSIRVTRLMLNMLLSLPIDTHLVLREDLYEFRDYVGDAWEFYVDLSGNTDLRQLDIQREILQKQFEIQRAQRYPNISAVAQYSVLSQSNDLKIGHYDWRGTSLVGLQLNIPIFSGFTNINRERQIKNNIRQLEAQRKYLEESVNVQAQTSISNLIEAKEQMAANESTRTQAQKGYSIAKTRYDVGAGTIVELNAAQMALLQADLNFSQSIYDYMSALADYEEIIGRTE
ncbi:MAG: TolC family protein [Rikenellaceae bacterium]|nr:TolC family protein [Rikenellaceae bacterium]